MAHVLCMTTGLTGVRNASFEAVRRLEAWGHRVTYASPWDVRADVARQGIAYRQLGPVDLEPAGRGDGAARLRAAMDAFAAVLDELRPDLVLSDLELPAHVITAWSRGARVALLNHFFAFWPRPRFPPVNRAMTPDAGRAAIALAWLELRARRRWQAVTARLRTRGADRRSLVRAHARRAGLPARELDPASWNPPCSFRTLPYLHLTARELEFPAPLPSNVTCVGPMVALARRDPDPAAGDLERLERVLADVRARGRRLVYASASSKDAGDRAFLARLVEAVGARDDWAMILGLGGRLDAAAIGASAPNVHAFTWVPQLRALERADAAVNQGGIHTIHESLHFRVPMLACSGGRYDQNGAVARVAYHGLGRVVAPDRAAPELRDDLAFVLEDRTVRANVEAMHDRIDAYRREHRLERAVDALLAAPPTAH